MHTIVAITNEVENCLTAGTLFRQNSSASQLMSAYAKIVGHPYLLQVLTPFVKVIEEREEKPQERARKSKRIKRRRSFRGRRMGTN